MLQITFVKGNHVNMYKNVMVGKRQPLEIWECNSIWIGCSKFCLSVTYLLRKMKTRDAVQEPNLWDGGNDVASIDIETKVI